MEKAGSPISEKILLKAPVEIEAQLHFIADALPALVSYIDKKQNYTFVNKAYCQWFGKRKEEIVGKSLREVLGETSYKTIRSYLEDALNGNDVSFEEWMDFSDARRYISGRYTPQMDEHGTVKGLVALVVDTTAQKKNEEEIRQQQQDLSEFLEYAPVGIHWIDSNGKIILANKANLNMLGYMREEYVGQNIGNFYADRDDLDYIFKRLMANEDVRDMEVRLQGKEGIIKHVLISCNALWKEGKIVNVRCFVRDITDRKLVEEYLREKNKTLQILNSIGNTISANLDLKKLLQSVTDATTEISGAEFGAFFYRDHDDKTPFFNLHSVAGAHQAKFQDFYAQQVRQVITPLFFTEQIIRINNIETDISNGIARALRSQGVQEIPFRSYMIMPVISKNGELFGGLLFAHSSVDVFTDRSEILVESIALQAAIAIDNSRLFEAKQAGEERFRVLAESVPQVIWTALPGGNLDYVNQKWTDYSAQPLHEALDSGWLNVVYTEDTVRTIMSWTNAVHTGSIYENELRLRRADGTYRWHLSRALPIKDKSGTIIKWFGSFTDIHDQKMLNEKKDEFIGIASHELKTPLTSIKAYVQLLERLLTEMNNDTAKTYVAKTQIYIDRLHHLIADLLDVTRIQAGKLRFNMTDFDFNEFMRESIENIQYTTTKQILLEGSASCRIKGDRQRLEQVCTNLLSNAIKYSPRADKVLVTVSSDSKEVKVAVTDFGIGIPKENLNRVFDRFYRVDGITHQFQGLGIGLYIANEIITRHKGRTWAESEEGKGSTFYFSLPVCSDLAEADPQNEENKQ
jgi:PAS domain S-box-containing protein